MTINVAISNNFESLGCRPHVVTTPEGQGREWRIDLRNEQEVLTAGLSLECFHQPMIIHVALRIILFVAESMLYLTDRGSTCRTWTLQQLVDLDATRLQIAEMFDRAEGVHTERTIDLEGNEPSRVFAYSYNELTAG